jgi:hypothetical protein
MCVSSDPPLFFVIFASFIGLFGVCKLLLPTFQNKPTPNSPAVVFLAVLIYSVVQRYRQGARREETPPAYVLLPSAGHNAELEFDFAKEGEGDVKAPHIQALDSGGI